MNVHFTARLPAEIVAKVKKEARRRHTTSTAVVLEALERHFGAGPERDLRAALILTANALAGGDREKAAALRRAALEMAERELEKERGEPCSPG